MVALADLVYSREYNRTVYGVDRAEQISARHVPSANAALRELYRLSGVLPGIRYPYGGSRTDAEGRKINPSLSPSLSDHNYRKARALDVDNRGAITAGIARKQGVTYSRATRIYYDTWAKFGWRNIQINGAPFPLEPWHLANHSSKPAGSPGVPLPVTPSTPAPTPPEDPVSVLITAKDQPTKPTLFVNPGSAYRFPSGAELDPFRSLTRLTRKDLSDADFLEVVQAFGFTGWTMERLAAIPPGATVHAGPGDIDESALAGALAPLLAPHLAGVTRADLDAALAAAAADIIEKIPTTFRAA